MSTRKVAVMSQIGSAMRQGNQAFKTAPTGRRVSVAPSKIKRRRKVIWLHVPAFVFMLVMTQIPFVLALWFSLHSWNLLEPAQGFPFVGLTNYVTTFVGDPNFWPIIGHTIELVFGAMAL